ncbi:MAG: aldehyde ferredoxin oxidoreductase family protein [Chloroflexota bacterium]
MFGYMGKLLRVNLTNRTIKDEPLDLDLARAYIGGAGYGTRIIHDEVPPDTDPLSPANKLVFMTGPMTATIIPTTARFEVCTKSPLTNMWLDASSSGWWGRVFKLTGYDGIIVEGAADKPVYLWMQDDRAELRDASSLWGLDATQTQDEIRTQLDDKRVRVACIGTAGEKLIPLACIMNDDGRAAGRGGAGAVMGSKKLKAIAVRGKKRTAVADEPRLREAVKDLVAVLAAHPLVTGLSAWGTAFNMHTGWAPGDVPIKNWRKGLWREGCMALSGSRMAQTILVPHEACQGCSIRCARWIRIEQGPFAMEGPGPEYETLGSFGTMLMNDNLEAVCWVNDLCNRYGVDTISAGAAVAFAMEAYEKGVITKDDAGCDLTWGNVDAIIEMTQQIGEGRGLGALLGKGVKRAAAELGKGSEAYAVHVKGMEVPMHDPRAYFSMAATYATGPRGACHLHGLSYAFEQGVILPEGGITYRQGRFDRAGKGLAAKVMQDTALVLNSCVVCMFCAAGMQLWHVAAFLEMVTGERWTAKDVVVAGERISNLQRVYNLKCGITAADDKLPPRLLEPTDEGGHAGKVPDLAYQLAEYYQVRGWDENGRPTPAKLAELGLTEVVGKF